MRSTIPSTFSSLLRLVLLLALLLQATCSPLPAGSSKPPGSKPPGTGASTPSKKLEMLPVENDEHTRYIVIEPTAFTVKPEIKSAQSAAAATYRLYTWSKDQPQPGSVRYSYYEVRDPKDPTKKIKVPRSHFVFALSLLDKRTVVASVPFGEAAKWLQRFAKTNAVFKDIVGNSDINQPHAEHLAIAIAIEKLGAKKADIQGAFGATFGLQFNQLKPVEPKTNGARWDVVVVPGQTAGSVPFCSNLSKNVLSCSKMLSDIPVRTA